MTKEQFLKLNREIGLCMPPDLHIRKEFMENQFTKMGISKQNGYKSVQYFYDELVKAFEKKNSFFKGKICTPSGKMAIYLNGQLTFNMKTKAFKERKNLFFPKTLPPQQTETKTEQKTPTFENNFDTVKPIDIYEHFKTGLIEKRYLTEQQLIDYLKAAFELKTIPETLFKIQNRSTKQKIYTVFYTYYKDIAGKTHGTQRRYVELLGNYFEGYNNEVISTNWARDYEVKR